MFIHANWRMDVRVKHNMYATIGGSWNTCIGGEYAVTVGGNNDHHVKSDYIFEFNGKQEGTIDNDWTIGAQGATRLTPRPRRRSTARR